MYATDRRQTKASLNAPPIRGGGIKKTRMALVTAHRVLDHNKANFEHDDLQWLVPGGHRKTFTCARSCHIWSSKVKRYEYMGGKV